MMLILAIIILSIYFVCPLIGKLALLLANMVLPDPIPFVDEIIMWVGLLMDLSKLMDIAIFIRTHAKTIKKVLIRICYGFGILLLLAFIFT